MSCWIKRLFGIGRQSERGELPPASLPRPHPTLRVAGIDVAGLPFKPSPDEVIFSEGGHDEATNAYIVENMERISARLLRHGLRFTYLPAAAEQLLADAAAWRYRKPYGDIERPESLPALASDLIINHMCSPENRGKVAAPAMLRCNEHSSQRADGSWCRVFTLVEFRVGDIDDFDSYFDAMAASLKVDVGATRFSLRHTNVDDAFEFETRRLLDETRLMINRLMHRGVSEAALAGLVMPEARLSPIVITADNRILLPLYGNIEIEMTPLAKAVYFLFLRHPEGIMFKELADYREELAQLYDNIKGGRPSTHRLLGMRLYNKSIIALTNPLNNSINEKCTRIKEAFLTRFHDHLAHNYYVTGVRGEPKRVLLDKSLVTWQQPQ